MKVVPETSTTAQTVPTVPAVPLINGYMKCSVVDVFSFFSLGADMYRLTLFHVKFLGIKGCDPVKHIQAAPPAPPAVAPQQVQPVLWLNIFQRLLISMVVQTARFQHTTIVVLGSKVGEGGEQVQDPANVP